jgi:hypothetical protein
LLHPSTNGCSADGAGIGNLNLNVGNHFYDK